MPPAPAPAPPTPVCVPPAPVPVAPGGGTAGSSGRRSPARAPGRALHHAGIHAQRDRAGFCAQQVGIRNGEVVTLQDDVQVVLQRHGHRIVDGQVHLAVAEQLIGPRGIAQVRRRHAARRVRCEHIGEWRFRLRVVSGRNTNERYAAAPGPAASASVGGALAWLLCGVAFWA